MMNALRCGVEAEALLKILILEKGFQQSVQIIGFHRLNQADEFNKGDVVSLNFARTYQYDKE